MYSSNSYVGIVRSNVSSLKTLTIHKSSPPAMIIIPPIATIATAAAGAATVLLSSASLFNMYEMHSLVQQHPRYQNEQKIMQSALSSLSIHEAKIALQQMSRKELIQLFLECDAPTYANGAFCCFNDDNHRENDDDMNGGSNNSTNGEKISIASSWKCDGFLLDNGRILVRNILLFIFYYYYHHRHDLLLLQLFIKCVLFFIHGGCDLSPVFIA